MKRGVCFLIAFGLWVLFVWPTSWSKQWPDVALGAVFAVIVTFALTKAFPEYPLKIFNPKRWFFFIIYIPYFLYWCIIANFDVAYRVLHPDVPIHPGIVKVRTNLKTEMAKTFLANSITLTPGTLSVDIDGQDFYIHWINVKGTDEKEHTRLIISRFEGLLREIFE